MDGYLATGGFAGYNLYTYCANNPVMLVDFYGNCPYDGTAADFHRLEHDLPPIKCNCVAGRLAEETEIDYDEEEDRFVLSIDVSKYNEILNMDVDEFNKYVEYVSRKLYREHKVDIKKSEYDAYVDELLLHVWGWDVPFEHKFKEQCRIAEIEIVNGKVCDDRPQVKVGVMFVRYIREKIEKSYGFVLTN